ncbi:hypothetical protein MKX08_000714 [Trichoderma sp. CBMAI-0020]|nr:hypothetical protein MKX08_000714 [Trichoderma sp. CBMAI-0020]
MSQTHQLPPIMEKESKSTGEPKEKPGNRYKNATSLYNITTPKSLVTCPSPSSPQREEVRKNQKREETKVRGGS